ncbi:predicted protein [Histoplasma capsulatum H143]|uniref:Uncharacterized protein n=1 Tax=Ajellomyces capsulatus (strain H143) TaxID=544712 RepID=C6HK24_AJECH|nr:predicted protein [Histoplasma capsulatum H143]
MSDINTVSIRPTIRKEGEWLVQHSSDTHIVTDASWKCFQQEAVPKRQDNKVGQILVETGRRHQGSGPVSICVIQKQAVCEQAGLILTKIGCRVPCQAAFTRGLSEWEGTEQAMMSSRRAPEGTDVNHFCRTKWGMAPMAVTRMAFYWQLLQSLEKIEPPIPEMLLAVSAATKVGDESSPVESFHKSDSDVMPEGLFKADSSTGLYAVPAR